MCVRACARRRAHDHHPLFSLHSLQSPRNQAFSPSSIGIFRKNQSFHFGKYPMIAGLRNATTILSRGIRSARSLEMGCYSVGGMHPLDTARRGRQARRLAWAGLSRQEISKALGISIDALILIDRHHTRIDRPRMQRCAQRLAVPAAPSCNNAGEATAARRPTRPILSIRPTFNRSNDHAGI